MIPQLLGPMVPESPAGPEEKAPLESITIELGLEPSSSGSQTVPAQQSQFGELACALEPGQEGQMDRTQPLVNKSLESVFAGGGGAGATRKVIPHLPVRSPPQTMYCDHLGMRLFWGVLLEAASAVADYGAILKQWLACIFLGAVNIEQTRFLNGNDLRDLLGPVLRSPEVQRRELTQSAHQATVAALFRLDARRLAAPASKDCYRSGRHLGAGCLLI